MEQQSQFEKHLDEYIELSRTIFRHLENKNKIIREEEEEQGDILS